MFLARHRLLISRSNSLMRIEILSGFCRASYPSRDAGDRKQGVRRRRSPPSLGGRRRTRSWDQISRGRSIALMPSRIRSVVQLKDPSRNLEGTEDAHHGRVPTGTTLPYSEFRGRRRPQTGALSHGDAWVSGGGKCRYCGASSGSGGTCRDGWKRRPQPCPSRLASLLFCSASRASGSIRPLVLHRRVWMTRSMITRIESPPAPPVHLASRRPRLDQAVVARLASRPPVSMCSAMPRG